MDLEIFSNGNQRPTSDGDGVHTPIIWHFDEKPVRLIVVPFQSADRAIRFVRSDLATALGYKAAHKAGEDFGLIEGEDRGGDIISTPGGPQKLVTLTWKGVSKLLMRSNHEKAVKFQDWLASKSSDLTFYGIAIKDKSAAEVGAASAAPAIDYVALTHMMTTAVTVALTTALAPVLARLDRLEGSHQTCLKIPGLTTANKLPRFLKGKHGDTYKAMSQTGYMTASDFLFKKSGAKPTAGQAGSLAIRCGNYCASENLEVKTFNDGPLDSIKGKKIVFLPLMALELVHRYNWSAKNRRLAEGQMHLPLFRDDDATGALR